MSNSKRREKSIVSYLWYNYIYRRSLGSINIAYQFRPSHRQTQLVASNHHPIDVACKWKSYQLTIIRFLPFCRLIIGPSHFFRPFNFYWLSLVIYAHCSFIACTDWTNEWMICVHRVHWFSKIHMFGTPAKCSALTLNRPLHNGAHNTGNRAHRWWMHTQCNLLSKVIAYIARRYSAVGWPVGSMASNKNHKCTDNIMARDTIANRRCEPNNNKKTDQPHCIERNDAAKKVKR